MTVRIPLAIALALAAAPAGAETFTGILSDDARTIAYTPCSAEDAAECISHVIDCRGDGAFGNGMAMTLLGASSENPPDVRKLAKALLDKEWGEAKVTFTIGGKAVELPVNAVTVSLDEMNGDWDLSLHFQDDSALFDALTDASAASVTANVAGYSVPLASTKDGGADLMKFKQACTG
jgi:hypothetical protein